MRKSRAFIGLTFILLLVASAATAALGQGVIVRPLKAFGIPNAIRVSTGSAEENEIFIDHMRRL